MQMKKFNECSERLEKASQGGSREGKASLEIRRLQVPNFS
jgi:hypothetical protein